MGTERGDYAVSRYPPELRLQDWQATRDTLHGHVRAIGRLRSRYAPKAKHWWHGTLHVCARGLTTTPFPVAGQNLELTLDLAAHRLTIDSSAGWSAAVPLSGLSAAGLGRWITPALAASGITLEPDLFADFAGEQVQAYDAQAAERYRRALNWVDGAFKTFQGGLREETSPVHLFPHHMDLAMSWFSGRLVPDADPADEEHADEQMGFGFVTGDRSIADTYFYATAYPAPDAWTDLALPDGTYWHTHGWTGAVLPYAALVAAADPLGLLLGFLETVQAHGAHLMR